MALLLNHIKTDILEGLGRFQYLSVSQCQKLTGKSLSYLREQLAEMVHLKMISSYHVVVTAKVRAENIYYLLPKGRDILIEYEKAFAADIKLPIGTPSIVRDYFHRLHFIDVQIALWQHLQTLPVHLVSFKSYFEKAGNTRAKTLEAQTKIMLSKDSFFVPDGVMITDNGGNKSLYLIEQFEDNSATRPLMSLWQHGKAMSSGVVGNALGIRPHVVLSVFAHEGVMKAAIKSLRDNTGFTAFVPYYFFASLNDVQSSVQRAFTTIDNTSLAFK